MEDNIGARLRVAGVKRDKLWKAYEQAHAQASSVLKFTLQWKDLEEHLDSTHKALDKGLEEMASREKRVEEAQREVEQREGWVALEEKLLKDLKEKVGKCEEQLGSVQSRVLECSKELKLKNEQLWLADKSLEKCSQEVELKRKQLCTVEKTIEERSRDLDLRETQLSRVQYQLEKHSKEVESREDQLARLSREYKFQEDQLVLVETLFEERSTELASKEGELEKVQQLLAQAVRNVSLKEEKLGEVQKLLTHRSAELSLKDEELVQLQKLHEDRSKEVASQTERLGELDRELTSRKSALGAMCTVTKNKWTELQSIKKNIDLLKTSIQEYSADLISKQKEYELVRKSVEEQCAELISKQKEYESLEKSCHDLKLKEKEYEFNRKSLDNLFAELRSKEKEYEMKRKSFEEAHAESESKENKLDSVVELLNSLSKELEEKKEQLVSVEGMIKKYDGDVELREREFKEIQESVGEHNELLKSKEKQLQSIQTSIENQDRELRQKKEEHDSIQKSILQCSKELELKVKDHSSVQKSIRGLFDELELKQDKLYSAQKTVDESRRELALKENNFNSMRRSIEEGSVNLQMKEKKFEEIVKDKEKQLELFQKSVEERIKEVELKEKRLIAINTSPLRNPQGRDFLLNNTIESSYTSRESFASIDGKTLQLFINEHLSRHDLVRSAISAAFGGSSDPAMLVLDAMQGFYPNSGEGSLQFDSAIIKRSCILLLEQLMRFSPQIKPQVREEARMVANQWKARMTVEPNSLDVLAFLQLLATYGLASIFNPDELRKLTDMVAQHSRQVSELRHAFGFKEMAIGRSISCAKIKMEEGESIVAQDALIPFSKDTQTNAPISILSFLEDHSDVHDSTANEISNALKTTLDPALVVLDAIKRSCHQEWETGLRNLKGNLMIRYSLVLEHLERASTPITSYVKEGAEKLAIKWKAELRNGTGYSLKVLVFLHLLAAYGLLSSFDRDEILELFLTVAHRNKAPELGRALGLSDKMNDIINSLIKRKLNLEAIAFIDAFQLSDKFSPILLLQKYLQNARKSVNKIRRRGKQDLATEKEVAAYRAAGKCMSDYKLDNKFLANVISKRLMELQGKMEDERSKETRTPATNDHVQEQSVNIAASSAAKVQLQQVGMQSMTPSAPVDHSQQKSCNTAAMPSTGNELQKKVVKLRREWPSISPSGQPHQSANDALASPSAKVHSEPKSSDNINSTAYNNQPKCQTISNAATTVMEAELQHNDGKKESARNSTSKNQLEQQRNYVVAPSSLAMEGTTISASEDYSHYPSVSKPATPAVQVKHEPNTMKRDFKCTFSSKNHAKWERNNKRRKTYPPRPHTSGTVPGTGMHMNSSAWRPHRPSGTFNEGVGNFNLPPAPTRFGVEGGWPNMHHSGTQFFPPYWYNRH